MHLRPRKQKVLLMASSIPGLTKSPSNCCAFVISFSELYRCLYRWSQLTYTKIARAKLREECKFPTVRWEKFKISFSLTEDLPNAWRILGDAPWSRIGHNYDFDDFFAQLQILRKLRFFAILVIFTIFLKLQFSLSLSVTNLANTHLATNLTKIAIFCNSRKICSAR